MYEVPTISLVKLPFESVNIQILNPSKGNSTRAKALERYIPYSVLQFWIFYSSAGHNCIKVK